MNIDELINFNGNEQEFEKYRKELDTKYKHLNIYDVNYFGNIENGFGEYYSGGKLRYEGFFKEKKYSGKGILYKYGKKIYEGYFINGNYDGIGIEYLLNGNRRRKAFYSEDEICDECYGILYNENNEEIYNGLLREGIPKEGKSLIIYSNEEDILYKGDFLSYKYDGKGILYYRDKIQYEGEFKNNKYEGNGILYYENSNNIYYKGTFKEGEIINGILYDIEGKKIYEGEIRNNMPKEGTNLKLYTLYGNLKYEGDILGFLYHGKGKIYKIYKYRNHLIFDGIFNQGEKVKGTFFKIGYYKYEGEFKNDKYNGIGKIYALDDENKYYLYYEGNFKDMEFSGNGIKYYKNGKKKIEGKFENISYFCK